MLLSDRSRSGRQQVLDACAEFLGLEKLRRLFFFFVVTPLSFAFWSSGGLLFAGRRRWRRRGARGVCCCGAGALIGVVPGPRHERERPHSGKEEKKKGFASSKSGSKLRKKRKNLEAREILCSQSPTSHQLFIERDGRLLLRAGDKDRRLGQRRAVI